MAAPGFYLHLGADAVYAGSGIWRPDGPTLGRIRAAIVERPAAWRRVMATKSFQPLLPLAGASLKRPPRGYDADHPLVGDLMRKDFITMLGFGEAEVCRPDFIDRFTDTCRMARPFVRFLGDAVGLAV